ncbi:unnamed protein product [Caenorhabditis auriculariae]|uniref:Uncharacterized protein n=1 Tax=Caenorhabditis auriculariae TaxID=2777116 RepID=A0A8S1H3R6_9PELO|nr:unnamed protein product [Caenorhabditis auriculariae]
MSMLRKPLTKIELMADDVTMLTEILEKRQKKMKKEETDTDAMEMDGALTSSTTSSPIDFKTPIAADLTTPTSDAPSLEMPNVRMTRSRAARNSSSTTTTLVITTTAPPRRPVAPANLTTPVNSFAPLDFTISDS